MKYFEYFHPEGNDESFWPRSPTNLFTSTTSNLRRLKQCWSHLDRWKTLLGYIRDEDFDLTPTPNTWIILLSSKSTTHHSIKLYKNILSKKKRLSNILILKVFTQLISDITLAPVFERILKEKLISSRSMKNVFNHLLAVLCLVDLLVWDKIQRI